MRVFTTKYALSSGAIDEVEVEEGGSDPEYVYSHRPWTQYRMGRDAFLTRADAIAAADAARVKKIASLKKQIAKLEELRFE